MKAFGTTDRSAFTIYKEGTDTPFASFPAGFCAAVDVKDGGLWLNGACISQQPSGKLETRAQVGAWERYTMNGAIATFCAQADGKFFPFQYTLTDFQS